VIPRRLAEIAEEHLVELIDQGRREDRTIEYKVDWPTAKSSDRGPVIEAVVSFANEIGGDLVIGVRAEDGLPVDVPGVAADNVDAMCMQLDQVIRAQTDPMCSSHTIRPIQLASGRYVFVVRVGESWVRPHRVKANNKFIGRGSAGKYEMDTAQIRSAFLRLLEVPERARRYREERFNRIRNGTLPFKRADGILCVLHVMPLRQFIDPGLVASKALYDKRDGFRPRNGMGLSTRINLDGIYNFAGVEPLNAAVQVLRSGTVESIDIYSNRDIANMLLFPIGTYERDTVKVLPTYLQTLEALGISEPYYAFLSFVFPAGTCVPATPGLCEQLKIDRQIVLIPEVEIPRADADIPLALRPAFDAVWNAWGKVGSRNYDAQGNWAPVVR